MEQILLTYRLPKETITALMMLYKNTKALVHSLDGETNFFNIARVLQWDALVPYMFIICLDLIKENGFTLKKTRST